MPSIFLQYGLIACLGLTLLSSLSSFAGGAGRARRIGQALLIFGTGLGALAGAAALALHAGAVPLFPIQALFGARFALQPIGAVFFTIVNLVSCLAAVYAARYLDENAGTYDPSSLGGTAALFILGMQLTLLAASTLGFMASWELMSLSSFALVMADRAEASRKAALLYFAMAQLGAAAIMGGFLLLSGGSLAAGFGELAAHARTMPARQLLAAFILFFVGFGSKAGLVPLHTWLPEAHPQAPSHASALMSGVMLKVAVYGFIVSCMIILPGLPAGAGLAVMAVGLISAVFGALHAAVEIDIKRTLAWSSVENLGLIFLMLGTALYARTQGLPELAAIAVSAALFHCAAHAIFKSGLFLAAGAIVHATGTRSLERMGGLANRMPSFSGAFLVLTLAAAALPPFAGFIGEWLYLSGLVAALPHVPPLSQAALTFALVGAAFTAGIAVFAMVKLFAISQLGAPRSPGAENAHAPSSAVGMPVMVLAALAGIGGALAIPVLRAVGAAVFLNGGGAAAAIVLPGNGFSLSPLALAAGVLGALALAVLVERALVPARRERSYHTWDCGQPITARMEYTATAFSAPIRFFFRSLIGVRKTVVAIPASANPLAAKREMHLASRSFWVSHVHEPVSRGLHHLADRVRRIQSGSIQLYLLLILAALVVTLAIAV